MPDYRTSHFTGKHHKDRVTIYWADGNIRLFDLDDNILAELETILAQHDGEL